MTQGSCYLHSSSLSAFARLKSMENNIPKEMQIRKLLFTLFIVT